jgi:hypothetical protein
MRLLVVESTSGEDMLEVELSPRFAVAGGSSHQPLVEEESCSCLLESALHQVGVLLVLRPASLCGLAEGVHSVVVLH